MTTLGRSHVLCTLALLALTLATSPAGAAKTDVVVLRNGDRLTGEVDRLERGRLRFKTDDMGTLDIEWDKVGGVTAAATFEIEDLAGEQYYGALRAPLREGTLNLSASGGNRDLDMSAVVRISRLGETFWKRLDGSIDLGTSYTSASELLTLDLAAETRYERPGYELSTDLSATLTRQADIEDTRRASLGLNFLRRCRNRWLYFGQGLLEQNRELGFTLRGSLAAGAGRYLVQSRRDDLLTAAGLSVNRELPVEGDASTNTEFLLTFRYDRFSYDFPKVDVLVALTGFESLTDWGRTRAELDASLRRELLKDFSLTMRVYESFDSRPATAGVSHNDFGLTFAVGWSF